MRSSADRGLARLLAGGPAALAAALLACAVASPATEVKDALARLGPIELDAGPARVALARTSFSDVTVSMDGARALVVAVVEADGRVRLPGAAPTLAYVGREAFALDRCASRRWCLAPDALAGLRGAVAALAAAPGPERARPVAWQVRVERDRAEAGEDYEATDGGAPRRLRAVRALARDGAGWRIAASP